MLGISPYGTLTAMAALNARTSSAHLDTPVLLAIALVPGLAAALIAGWRFASRSSRRARGIDDWTLMALLFGLQLLTGVVAAGLLTLS